MRIMRAFGCAVVMLLSLTAAAAGAQSAGDEGGFVITEAKFTQEKVVDIDHAARKVTLKDASGKVRTIKVGIEIHNLNKVKVGDEVTIETVQNIAVDVKPGPGDTMNFATEGQTAPLPGAKPSATRTIEGKLRTQIESIDYKKRTITFKGRTGAMTTYQIGPEAKRFNEIRRGDMLWVEYSETVTMVVK